MGRPVGGGPRGPSREEVGPPRLKHTAPRDTDTHPGRGTPKVETPGVRSGRSNQGRNKVEVDWEALRGPPRERRGSPKVETPGVRSDGVPQGPPWAFPGGSRSPKVETHRA